MELKINGKTVHVDVPADTPLLWAIRDEIGLTGTKYGCGMALCGACTVYMGGEPIRSCVTPISAAQGQEITTIEGLRQASPHVAKVVQDTWAEQSVPQCGYCQSGQVMAATALLSKNKKPTDDQIDAAMSGNICRCGTYQRIRAAIHTASKRLG